MNKIILGSVVGLMLMLSAVIVAASPSEQGLYTKVPYSVTITISEETSSGDQKLTFTHKYIQDGKMMVEKKTVGGSSGLAGMIENAGFYLWDVKAEQWKFYPTIVTFGDGYKFKLVDGKVSGGEYGFTELRHVR